MANTAEWWTRNGQQPPGKIYPSVEAAKDAVLDFLTLQGAYGVQAPTGMRAHWEGDWRPLEEVPDGFLGGWELFDKEVAVGQRVLERAEPTTA